MLRSIYKPGGSGKSGNSSATPRHPLSNSIDVTAEQGDEGEEEEEEDEGGDSLGSLPSALMPPPAVKGGKGKLRGKDRAAAADDSGAYSPLSAEDCFQEALEVDIEGEGVWRVYRTPPKAKAGESAGESKPVNSGGDRRAPASTKLPSASPAASAGADATLASLSLPHIPDDDGDDDEGPANAANNASSSTPPSPGTLLLFHHGAGFSSLSFALTAREITRLTKGEVGVMAFDCRGHGRTRHGGGGGGGGDEVDGDDGDEVSMPPPPSSSSSPTPPSSPPLDMSLSKLTHDAVTLLAKLYDASTLPTLILAGHSMGGSVVVSLCDALQAHPTLQARVAGVVVMDVVEGTAMDALSGMRGIVEAQPRGFKSVEEAIRWHVDSGVIHNVDSARVSVPSLVIKNPNAQGGDASKDANEGDEPVEELRDAGDGDASSMSASSPMPPPPPSSSSTSSTLPPPPPSSSTSSPTPPTPPPYVWRADLLATSPHWPTWFQGLSQRFLACKTARMLLLAGTDRLDRDLMVGQMQGKYQLTVFPDVGHCLQEDAPEKTAQVLVEFWRRNEVGVNLLKAKTRMPVKKVGER